jgi:5-methyltetrahydropteroyltriglutamate--homocysteine methyltransferase
MVAYVATTPGLFPLPDWAKTSLSDLKGHQKHDLVSGDEPDAVSDEYERARGEVIETQLDAGLDRVVEGQLRWDDMLAHPLAVNDAVETHGLVRYYDNNNFYRDPVVVDSLEPSGDVGAELSAAAARTDAPLQAVLPGPYSLADLATDEHYGDPAEFLAAIGEFLAAETATFPPAETLFLLEPSLVTEPPDVVDQSTVRAAVDAVADAFDGDVVVHTYWGSLDEPTHATLLDATIDAIGYDLVTAPEASATLVDEYGTHDQVALGVVDAQNTLVEAPGDIRDQLDWFQGRLEREPETVYATANTELYYLPVSKFEAKLEVLGRAVGREVAA